MGWNNPPVPWAEFERKLSGGGRTPDAEPSGPGAAPSQTKLRNPPGCRNPRPRRDHGAGALRRTARPLELQLPRRRLLPRGAAAQESARLGLHALALTDHDGMYGIVRMAEAAEKYDGATVFGAELSLGLARAAERRPRPGGQPPARARPRRGGLPPAGRRAHRRAAGRRREGPPGLRPRQSWPTRRRALGGADRVPQGRGAAGARARRAGPTGARRRAGARPRWPTCSGTTTCSSS